MDIPGGKGLQALQFFAGKCSGNEFVSATYLIYTSEVV